ncbi:B3 domain-containing transcription factor VRN1 [Rosa sericea]
MSSPCWKIDQRPKFSATPLSFHKSISEKTHRDNNLRVPRSYVKKYEKKYEKKFGEELSNIVHLKLPCGTEWEIEVTRHNGVFWFDKGWETFCKFYSIESRYSLVFQYEGNSRFKVNIFDRTNSEIEYPIKTPKKEENDVDDQFPPASPLLPQKNNIATSNGDKKDLPAEVDEGDKSSSTQRSQKPTTEVLGRMHPSTTKGSGAVQTVKEFKYTKQPSCFLIPMCPSYIEKHMLWLPIKIFRAREAVDCTFSPDIDEADAHHEHDDDNGDNDAAHDNRSFTIIIRQSYTTRLPVPAKFHKHVTKNPDTANLSLPGGRRTWPISLKYEVSTERVRFQSGWSKFVRDNHLKVGDACEFVLTDETRLSFEVHIEAAKCTLPDDDEAEDEGDDSDSDCDDEYPLAPRLHKRKRSSSSTKSNIEDVDGSTSNKQFLKRRPDVRRSMSPIGNKKKDNALQRANAFKSVKPSFVVAMHPTYVCGGVLNLPCGFAKKHLTERPNHGVQMGKFGLSISISATKLASAVVGLTLC